MEKSYSSGDYQAYRYCIHDGKLSEVTIKVSEEASERDDFLTNCYQIKNTIEKIAKKNPKYFTLCYNKSFWVIFQIGNEDMMIYFTNDDYGTTDYYEEDTVFYEQLCCVVMNTIEERIWNMKVLENIRYIYT